MVELDTILSRCDDVLHATVGEETMMMSVKAGAYYGLNAVGNRVWELLESSLTVRQICARLCDEFDIDNATCETAILKFANELVQHGIAHAGTQ